MRLLDPIVNMLYRFLLHVTFDLAGNSVTFPWPERTVPYRFNENITLAMRLIILDAMYEIEGYSCVRFERYDPEAGDGKAFLDIVALEVRSCYASLGYRPNEQMILGLHQTGCKKRSVVIHELLHALGMQHTHQRNDRNDHVEIYRGNIMPEYLN
ncbi:zinc metalloproteinase nas-14-like [Penaeus indicus]|uniref:zinc metalloproteinase nas-14-like n=1 Tax=Penaeus indicus TaxID=29960 RepID=UPI00300C6EB0